VSSVALGPLTAALAVEFDGSALHFPGTEAAIPGD
jgi:hypothetical protein